MVLGFLFLWIGVCVCEQQLTIQMPNVDIEEEDAYMCFATPVSALIDYSLVGYSFDTTKGLTHHIGMAACEDYNSNYTYWNCKHDHGYVCSGRAVSLHGQAGTDITHSEMAFRNDVAVRLGRESHINYIISQAHYKNPVKASDHKFATTNATLYLTKERRLYTTQTILLGSDGFIPALSENYSCEMITKWIGIPVSGYSYSIHTHDLGVMVEGYLIRNGTKTLIGRHSPKHHGTATYEVDTGGELLIQPGDIIAARCIFNNPSSVKVLFGNAPGNEMCNFSLNFKYRSQDAMVYQRSIRVYQNCQNSTWCQNELYTSSDLCEQSKS